MSIFATLRSPFLPQSYAPFPAIWLLSLLFAAEAGRLTLSSFLAAYLVISIFLPSVSGVDPRLVAVVTTIPQVFTLALAVGVVRLTAHRPANGTARVLVRPPDLASNRPA